MVDIKIEEGYVTCTYCDTPCLTGICTECQKCPTCNSSFGVLFSEDGARVYDGSWIEHRCFACMSYHKGRIDRPWTADINVRGKKYIDWEATEW